MFKGLSRSRIETNLERAAAAEEGDEEDEGADDNDEDGGEVDDVQVLLDLEQRWVRS